ncbi:MAG TPA: molybdopterin-dependent oxidoreductase [Dermatophilaceae bacterium]|nr:molybdopterin-dependent oxidoreductase [Dermatophilaceae bacterium]
MSGQRSGQGAGRITARITKALDAVPQESDFTSRLRGPGVTSRVGLWLGVCFAVAFLTGIYSHVAQVPHPWLPLPTRPSSFYRVTQGAHVIAGTGAIPLLLVKLWSVYPKLFARVRLGDPRALLLHSLERASIAVLVASAIFELASGTANAAQWYPWGFAFPQTHFAVGWLAAGALLVHIAVKLPVIRDALARDLEADHPAEPTTMAEGDALSRRSLLRVTWLAAGVAVLATAGSTVPALRRVSVLGVRSGDGPSGVPVNTSARAAGVLSLATDPGYRLTVVGGPVPRSLSRADLEALPQTTASLPIACVEGWSASATWTGVRVRDLLDLMGVPADRDVVVHSLQPAGAYRTTVLPANFAADPDTLLALRLNGQPLSLDHGFPCRLIAPNRPGVLQTKWVSRLEVSP